MLTKYGQLECVTPKLEHFGISECTMCLNEDYTVRLKNGKNKSEEAVETELVSSDSATPGLTNQQLENKKIQNIKSFSWHLHSAF